MNKTAIVSLIIIVLVILGGWYWMSRSENGEMNEEGATTTPSAQGPSAAMGTNGSPDQGNMGQPDTGTPQQPATTTGADGSDISQNLTLGTDGNAKLGTYLIGWTGMTLYTYGRDSVGTTTCYGKCAQNWPPYTVPTGMHLNIAMGVNATNAGTIVRADGTTQVTYGGMPLYFYAGDKSGSDTNGQGIGKVWYVVKP
jgi:predicted lipoprotein with Yx(FWY)xxD motif